MFKEFGEAIDEHFAALKEDFEEFRFNLARRIAPKLFQQHEYELSLKNVRIQEHLGYIRQFRTTLQTLLATTNMPKERRKEIEKLLEETDFGPLRRDKFIQTMEEVLRFDPYEQ